MRPDKYVCALTVAPCRQFGILFSARGAYGESAILMRTDGSAGMNRNTRNAVSGIPYRIFGQSR